MYDDSSAPGPALPGEAAAAPGPANRHSLEKPLWTLAARTAGPGSTVSAVADAAMSPGAAFDAGDLIPSDRNAGDLFGGGIAWPAMVLRDAALTHNIDTLARFCRTHGLQFAPHGKTTMAPTLFRRQIEAGAWGISVATMQQAAVARAAGIRRILLAHQVLDAAALAWIVGELARDPELTFACFVDSPEGVAAASRAATAQGSGCVIPVILDVGYPGGRTGVRTAAEARTLAETVVGTDGVHLAGVNGYEGGLPDVTAVRSFFAVVRGIVEELTDAGFLSPGAIVTAGGSAYFDVVASDLAGQWAADQDVTIILRSGAYISHDDGVYTHKTAFNRIAREGELQPALRIWAQVVSAPEPGLAIAGMGKRDAPYDEGMPIPVLLRRAGSAEQVDIRGRITVPKMDDQHCYLRLSDGTVVRPGDLIAFGISHPCTAFDKWRRVLVVDEEDRVIDVISTYF